MVFCVKMMFYLIIPVHNRIEHTKKIIEQIRLQTFYPKVSGIIIIDDGSTDGTSEFLKEQSDVTILSGDGSLWWGGAVDLGMKWVEGHAKDDDLVLLLNDDTTFPPNLLETLFFYHQKYPNALIGCPLYEIGKDEKLISIGPMMHVNRVAIWDKLQDLTETDTKNMAKIYHVDALAGRGMLIPYTVIRKFGTMRPKLLPHYLADYEFSARMAKKGCDLVIATDAKIFTSPSCGNFKNISKGLVKYFNKGSPHNIVSFAVFFLLVGNFRQRLFSPLSVTFFCTLRAIKRRFVSKIS